MKGVPLRYSIRNLARRPIRTALTVLGLSLVVALIVFLASFGRSIARTVRVTGDPHNLVVVSKKAQSMELSSIAPAELDLMAADVEDVLQTGSDGPLFSREVFRFEEIRLGDDPEKHRAKLHGIRPELAPSLLAGFRLVGDDSELPEQGYNEILVGPRIAEDLGVPADRFEIDDTLYIGDTIFTIVGRFEAPGSLVEHWFIMHVEDLRLAIRRRDFSFARMKVKAGVDLDALASRLSLDERYQVRVLPETDYFADFAAGFGHFQTFAVFLAVVLSIGGILTGMNTMHNAVSGRIREIGVLRVLGFGKGKVFLSFLIEILLLCAAAGLVGCAISWLTGPASRFFFGTEGLPMSLPFTASFPVVVDGVALAMGFLAALLMGFLGLLFPMARALGRPPVDAVRAVG